MSCDRTTGRLLSPILLSYSSLNRVSSKGAKFILTFLVRYLISYLFPGLSSSEKTSAIVGPLLCYCTGFHRFQSYSPSEKFQPYSGGQPYFGRAFFSEHKETDTE